MNGVGLLILVLFLIVFLLAQLAKQAALDDVVKEHNNATVRPRRDSVRHSVCHTACESHRKDDLTQLNEVPTCTKE